MKKIDRTTLLLTVGSAVCAVVAIILGIADWAVTNAPDAGPDRPKVTDWMQAWGSIGGVLAGLAAASAAALLLRFERRRASEAEHERATETRRQHLQKVLHELILEIQWTRDSLWQELHTHEETGQTHDTNLAWATYHGCYRKIDRATTLWGTLLHRSQYEDVIFVLNQLHLNRAGFRNACKPPKNPRYSECGVCEFFNKIDEDVGGAQRRLHEFLRSVVDMGGIPLPSN